MEVIEYFTTDNKQHWLSQLGKCKWTAGKVLYEQLKNGLTELRIGSDPKVFLLTDGDKLVSFCALSKKDDVPGYRLTPWIGFVYTFPQYRGHRFAGILLGHAEHIAYSEGFRNIYISTRYNGLYEKYGYELYDWQPDNNGDNAMIYMKRLINKLP